MNKIILFLISIFSISCLYSQHLDTSVLGKYKMDSRFDAKAKVNNVSGKWIGYEIQYDKTKTFIIDKYKMEFEFHQKGNWITGKTYIENEKGSYGIMKVRGYVDKNSVSFEEYEIIEEEMEQNYYWCLKSCTLDLLKKNDKEILEGYYVTFSSKDYQPCRSKLYTYMEKEKDESVITLRGKVFDVDTKKIIPNAQLAIIKQNSNKTIAKTNEEGAYFLQIQADQIYEINISAEGYFPSDNKVVLKRENNLNQERNFFLSPLKVGSTITLNNVLFEQSKAIMLEQSYPELDHVIKIMNTNPNIRILLTGHTDNQGDFNRNLKLSQDRVEVVKKYLVKHGVNKDRIEIKGFGSARPIASNSSEETRRLNRRVEFEILED